MPAVDLELERRLLAPWRQACARVLGRAPMFGRDAGGPVLQFTSDRSRRHAAAIGTVRIYADAVRPHLRALGYDWDEDGWLTTVPTPLSLRPRLRALGLEGGFTPEYHRVAGAYMSKRTWIDRQCAGGLPIAIAGASWYRWATMVHALPPWREHLIYHLHGLQHDMTKHALCTHLVPREALLELGDRVRSRARGWFIGETVSRFYENDLTGYCQSIWRDLPEVGAFVPTFMARENLSQLHAALEGRLARGAVARFEIVRPSRLCLAR